MVARTLITTADERTWPKDKNQPVLFLGEWCKRYSRKHIWENMDYKVARYHWDDRDKLVLDYRYIQEVYENILIVLSEELNRIHGVDHDLRYWRILIGPWLNEFIQIVFDRWYMIKKSFKYHVISKCYILERSEHMNITNDMGQFSEMYTKDDWNEFIYSQLLKKYWSNDVELVKVPLSSKNKYDYLKKKKGLDDFFRYLIGVYNRVLFGNKVFFIYNSIPYKEALKLQIKLHQAPRLWLKKEPSKVCTVNLTRKDIFSNKVKVDNKFISIIYELIPENIPLKYVEGYTSLVEESHKLLGSIEPKIIFTSVAYSVDDVFKCFAAEHTEQGVPLIIAQHGGHFGTTIFSSQEEHQIEISDKWLSWGWCDASHRKIIPFGNLKNIGQSLKHDSRGQALMIGLTLPRYSYHLYSVPISSQWLDYFQDQKEFIKELPDWLRKKILLRLSPQDYGWDQIARWKDTGFDIKYDDGEKSIYTLMEKSRLCISTYNATTFLESFYYNIPTIIFWSPGHYELNETAKTYYDELLTAGIFHESPTSAAKKMVEIWDDLDSWWMTDTVQNAKNNFCEQYARTLENPLDELQYFFEKNKK